ncbi:hypothetical protein, partial [Enterobacter asburiae]
MGYRVYFEFFEVVFFGAGDEKTSASVLYVAHGSDAGVFGGAAPRGAPNKPILVIKSGRSP